MRSDKPLHEFNRKLKSRAGIRINMRSYHLYLMKTAHVNNIETFGNTSFVQYEASKDTRTSKAKLIFEFIKTHSAGAYFSKEIVEALKDSGIKATDVMSNVRRFEHQGLIFVRGYRLNDRQTPFQKWYLLTWLDQELPREIAIEGAGVSSESVDAPEV